MIRIWEDTTSHKNNRLRFGFGKKYITLKLYHAINLNALVLENSWASIKGDINHVLCLSFDLSFLEASEHKLELWLLTETFYLVCFYNVIYDDQTFKDLIKSTNL